MCVPFYFRRHSRLSSTRRAWANEKKRGPKSRLAFEGDEFYLVSTRIESTFRSRPSTYLLQRLVHHIAVAHVLHALANLSSAFRDGKGWGGGVTTGRAGRLRIALEMKIAISSMGTPRMNA